MGEITSEELRAEEVAMSRCNSYRNRYKIGRVIFSGNILKRNVLGKNMKDD